MKKKLSIIICFALSVALLSGCFVFGERQEPPLFSSFRDIPGLTNNDIKQVEELLSNVDSFTYAMTYSTEAFIDNNGEIKGFAPLLCEWLTQLFDTEFVVEHFERGVLPNGLESGVIDFTGAMSPVDDYQTNLYMTEPIAQRSIMYFRFKPPTGDNLSDNPNTPLRYALLRGAVCANNALLYSGYEFETVFVDEYQEAYELLVSGEVDALLAASSVEAVFAEYDDVEVTQFYPLVYSPVSMTTQNPDLEIIIKVVQAAMNANPKIIDDLYEKGMREYLKYKMFLSLTEDELEYLKNNPVISFGAEYDNYPVSFFNEHTLKWQGICFEVLSEVSELIDVEFVPANNENAEFHELLAMLNAGDIPFVSELIRSAEREPYYLWPDTPFIINNSVLISKVEFPNITIDKVHSMKIGLSRDTAHTEFFLSLFPNHRNNVTFDGQDAAWAALDSGEVDGVISNYSALLYLTNYRELPDYKANIVFDNGYISTFGFNKDEVILRSIFNKALGFIDINIITEQWTHRRYDYLLSMAQAQRPWLYGVSVLAAFVVILLIVIHIKSRRDGMKLELLVSGRTRELALQTTTLSALLDSIPALIFTKDSEMRYTHCNKAFAEHFGIKPDDIIGKNNVQALGLPTIEADKENQTELKVMNEQSSLTTEEYIPGVTQEILLYETTRTPLILNDESVGVMGVAHDITKHKKIEELLLAASKTKSAFLANMSHEIRTPMNAILGITDVLTQKETLPDDVEEGLHKIHNSCNLLLGIINDILDFSKIEAGKMDIRTKTYKIADLIYDSAHLNIMRIESKPIVFELSVDENIPEKLKGDELRIKQILNNLLSNAFKYTDSGKVQLSITAEPAVAVPAHPPSESAIELIIKVRDTGCGMSAKQVEKLFDEYSRFNDEKNSTVEGTGLGLAITRRLASLMGGEIYVESTPNVGTLFTARLPQETVDALPLGAQAASALQNFRANYMGERKRRTFTREPMPYGSVLVVDDVETNLYVAVGLLKLYGLKIDTVMSGREALNKVSEGNVYDIIFMDHMMPEMDGIETTQKLRESGYKLPVIALTANAVVGQAEMFLKNGFDDFISKPIDTRQLDNALTKFIRDKQTPETIEAARAQKAKKPDNENVNQILIESFIRDARKTVEFLEGFTQENPSSEEIHNYAIFVHGIKSALANIGEKELSQTAYKLETAGREEDSRTINKETPTFLKKLKELLEKLEATQEQNDNVDENIDELISQFTAIEEACEDYDRKATLDIIATMKNCSKDTFAVNEKIKNYVLESDFEEAQSAAAAYKEKLSERAPPKPQGLNLSERTVEGLDIVKGLERYAGNEDAYLKILRSYTASLRSIVGRIDGEITQSVIGDYEINVHSVKGTSRDIFAAELGENAAELEVAASKRDLDYINAHNPAFVKAADALATALETLLKTIDDENPKPMKAKPEPELLSKLLTACKFYDIDSADEAMEEIDSYQYEDDDGLVAWLKEKHDMLKFSEIEKRLDMEVHLWKIP
ncbi:MAG: ATP-binding protein [Oscillospiraceae bacterium]|nr:ATP-binding protein [Oscillospiraceae bacterium]